MRDQLPVHLERRAAGDGKRSGIFPPTTFDAYDFDRPKTIDRDAVERAATLDFVRERTNVVFVGPSGVGKTHLANALGYPHSSGSRASPFHPPTSILFHAIETPRFSKIVSNHAPAHRDRCRVSGFVQDALCAVAGAAATPPDVRLAACWLLHWRRAGSGLSTA